LQQNIPFKKEDVVFLLEVFAQKKQDWKEPPVLSGSSSITIIIT
jgi:hypothetical protein